MFAVNLVSYRPDQLFRIDLYIVTAVPYQALYVSFTEPSLLFIGDGSLGSFLRRRPISDLFSHYRFLLRNSPVILVGAGVVGVPRLQDLGG